MSINVKWENVKPCKKCGSTSLDVEFLDRIGCWAYIECLDCRETSEPVLGLLAQDAVDEAVKKWNEEE
jgi:hypothetical protein